YPLDSDAPTGRPEGHTRTRGRPWSLTVTTAGWVLPKSSLYSGPLAGIATGLATAAVSRRRTDGFEREPGTVLPHATRASPLRRSVTGVHQFATDAKEVVMLLSHFLRLAPGPGRLPAGSIGRRLRRPGVAAVVVLALALTSTGATYAAVALSGHAGPQGDGTGITPTGWHVTPAGQQLTLGERPYGMALSPDGKHALAGHDGVARGTG